FQDLQVAQDGPLGADEVRFVLGGLVHPGVLALLGGEGAHEELAVLRLAVAGADVGGVDLDAGGAAHLVGELLHGECRELLLFLAGGDVAAVPAAGAACDEEPGQEREGGQTWKSRHVRRYAGFVGRVHRRMTQPRAARSRRSSTRESASPAADGGRVVSRLPLRWSSRRRRRSPTV